jgi:hypothetical protein
MCARHKLREKGEAVCEFFDVHGDQLGKRYLRLVRNLAQSLTLLPKIRFSCSSAEAILVDVSLMTERATRKPASDQESEAEPNGDEGVGKMAFRPRPRANSGHAPG